MGGNWKLNPTTITDATNLASELVRLSSDARDVDVVVFPPFPLLPFVREKLKDSSIKVILSEYITLISHICFSWEVKMFSTKALVHTPVPYLRTC